MRRLDMLVKEIRKKASFVSHLAGAYLEKIPARAIQLVPGPDTKAHAAPLGNNTPDNVCKASRGLNGKSLGSGSLNVSSCTDNKLSIEV